MIPGGSPFVKLLYDYGLSGQYWFQPKVCCPSPGLLHGIQDLLIRQQNTPSPATTRPPASQ